MNFEVNLHHIYVKEISKKADSLEFFELNVV
jgi:hypothetical protein